MRNHSLRREQDWASFAAGQAPAMKAWPGFDANGDLPPGIHPATLAEVVAKFGSGTSQRRSVARRLEHIYALAKASEHLARFIVFGSFVTAKPAPNDVGSHPTEAQPSVPA